MVYIPKFNGRFLYISEGQKGLRTPLIRPQNYAEISVEFLDLQSGERGT